MSGPANISSLQPHICGIPGVHMYFRTSSDLAPEICRFNGHGLQDTELVKWGEDLGPWWRMIVDGSANITSCKALFKSYGAGFLHHQNNNSLRLCFDTLALCRA